MELKKGIKIVIIIISVYIMYFYIFNTIRYVKDYNNEYRQEMFINTLKNYNPYMLYITSDYKKQNIYEKTCNILFENIPIKKCMYKKDKEYVKEYLQTRDKIEENEETLKKKENTIEVSSTLYDAVLLENNVKEKSIFKPVENPVVKYTQEQLKINGFIKENFYIEDSTTYLKEEQSNYDVLSSFDSTLKQDNSKPQILIYHTHSQETYINSDPLDEKTTIIGVGDKLSEILREEYGFNVIHHKGKYDVENRDYAYSNAMSGLEKVLQENPSIEVIIDLHRDEVREDTKLITTIQDIPMAKIMFFNGLSYTKELGELESLPNPYVQDNLSFSFQMQMEAEQYYPGLARKIYLKGYRYNLHYRAKSLLIELGAQTNTVEEAMNSCEPLAHIISLVINEKK